MISQRILTMALVGTLGVAAASRPTDAQAQALPTPRDLVSGLDLECYQTPGPALNIQVTLAHLNPVLLALGLQPHQVTLQELTQTCVPVRKNNVAPSASAQPFIEHIDFGCYRVEGAAALPNPVQLNLTHLNPVLAGLPLHAVALTQPAQLCVPMAKNGILPPPAVLSLVRFTNLECYNVLQEAHPSFGVTLAQLNPQLTGIGPHPMTTGTLNRHLCVPVRFAFQDIPASIQNLIQWIDLERFRANPNVTIPPVNVVLQHLNPRFSNVPNVPVTLQDARGLLVPVAKNGAIPPN